MKNNLKLFAFFLIIFLLMNFSFVNRPFFRQLGGCSRGSIFGCMTSLDLYKIFFAYTLFDFLLYSIVIIVSSIILFLFTRSVTRNKYYKHIFMFLFVKLIFFSILFLRQYMPINYIYVFLVSVPLLYLVEVKLAYNELMVGNGRMRFFITLMPSSFIGLFKLLVYYLFYPVGLFMITEIVGRGVSL